MGSLFGFSWRLVTMPVDESTINVEERQSSEGPFSYFWPTPGTGAPLVTIEDVNTRRVLSISTATDDPVEIDSGSGANPVLVFAEADLSP